MKLHVLRYALLTPKSSIISTLRSWLSAHCSPLTVICFMLVTLSTVMYAQSEKPPRLSTEPLTLVDLPTAGMLYNRNVSTSLEFLDQGGMSFSAQCGVFNRVLVGLAFGGTNVIGDQKAIFNPHVGMLLRVRAFEESYYVPAIVAGFSSQGKGVFIDSLNRYTSKSPGFYITASKNFEALGFFSIHAGIHYSLEDTDNRTLDFYGGVEKTFATIFSAILEYDNGVSLANSNRIDKGRGLLNLGLRATIGNGFILGLNVKDLIQNQQNASIGNRTMYIEYAQTF